MTLAVTALALVVLPATTGVAVTSIGSDYGAGRGTGGGVSVNGTGRVIAINGLGFGLSEMMLAVGETVSFMNLDAVPHEVRLEPATGSTCQDVSMVVWPGAYRACTFTSAGTYSTSDPSAGSAAFHATITVAAATDILSAVALTIDQPRVVAGRSVRLAGSINIPRSGAQVDIVAKDLSTGVYRKAGQTRTGSSGEFVFVARPARTTAYFANAILNTTVVTSPMQTVTVSPKGKA